MSKKPSFCDENGKSCLASSFPHCFLAKVALCRPPALRQVAVLFSLEAQGLRKWCPDSGASASGQSMKYLC